MKNLATRCLPEMANHGSIKIRVGKEAEASQKGTRIKEWQQLAIPVWRNKSIIGWEVAKGTFEGVTICELQTASAINLVQGNVPPLPTPHQWPKKLKENLHISFAHVCTSSVGSILSYLMIIYSYHHKTLLSLIL